MSTQEADAAKEPDLVPESPADPIGDVDVSTTSDSAGRDLHQHDGRPPFIDGTYGLPWTVEDVSECFPPQGARYQAFCQDSDLAKFVGKKPKKDAVIKKVVRHYHVPPAHTRLVWDRVVTPAVTARSTIQEFIDVSLQGAIVNAFSGIDEGKVASKAKVKAKATPGTTSVLEAVRQFGETIIGSTKECCQVPLDVRKFHDPPPSIRVKTLDPERVQKILKAFNKQVLSPAKVVIFDETLEQQQACDYFFNDNEKGPARFQEFVNSETRDVIDSKIGRLCIFGGTHSTQALIKSVEDDEVPGSTERRLSMSQAEIQTWLSRLTYVFRFSKVPMPDTLPDGIAAEEFKEMLLKYLASMDNMSHVLSGCFRGPGPAA